MVRYIKNGCILISILTAIKDFPQGVSEYNAVNNELNQNRKTLIDNYNKTSSTFLDKHTPKYK